MRVAERHREPAEPHFTEGEPDLEPPEELAMVELDDEAILEEDLDNEDVLEQDVDEDTLEVTLEDLIHDGDEGDDPDDEADRPQATALGPGDPGDEDADMDGAGEDVEEELDVILLERLAPSDLQGAEDADDEPDDGDARPPTGRRLHMRATDEDGDGAEVARCGPDEFVCESCFLVRHRAQLAGPAVCRDCA